MAMIGCAAAAEEASTTEPMVADPAGKPMEAWATSRLKGYEPVYVALGAHELINAKFQLSFRYLVTKQINVAYTQTSIWNLESDSKPFYDTSYKPRAFWREDRLPRPSWMQELAIEGGVGHESNGLSEPNSRSFNMAFVRPDLQFQLSDPWRLRLYPMAMAYLEKSENDDLQVYRGYVDLVAGVQRGDWGGLSITSRIGTGWDKGSIEAQYTYPLGQWLGGGEAPYLFLQWFNGYGESLLDYNQRTPWQVRLGFAIVR